MSVFPCRLCGHEETEVALSLPGSPRNIQKLLTGGEIASDAAIDLIVRQCPQCGFVQLPPVLDDAYYDDYLMSATHSAQMQAYQQRQARDFIDRFDLVGRRVLEAGCGDGNFLHHLDAAGAQVFGIEPSRRFRELALAKGFAVDSGYLTARRTLQAGPFDAFVSRQVLEHVPDIHDFLSGVRHNLCPGAPGLVEVPSLEKALADRRYYDFFSDHVNYFSLKTLRLALELNGFEVVDELHDMFGEYNVALVRAPAHPDLRDIQQTATDLAAELRAFVSARHAAGEKVGVWGAGGKGLSVLATAALGEIDLLVDSDRCKQGLYTPVSHLLVQAPTAQELSRVNALIVTAMAYRHEIEATLRNDYGFAGTIAFLGHRLEFA